MIKEALEFLKDANSKEFFPRIIKPEAEPRSVYLLAKEDGAVERMVAIPSPRDHLVSDIPSLIRALTECSPINALAYTANGQDKEDAKKSIWYNRESVVGVFDDSARSDRVTLTLGLSPQIEALGTLSGSMDQKQLIRFLKHTMSGCLGQTGDFLSIIRAIKFSVVQTGDSTRVQGRASIGNRLEAELTGANALPEYVLFTVPVFANPLVQIVEEVACTLDVDESTQTFKLCPVPLAVETAIVNAERKIGLAIIEHMKAGKIKAEEFVLLHGSPDNE